MKRLNKFPNGSLDCVKVHRIFFLRVSLIAFLMLTFVGCFDSKNYAPVIGLHNPKPTMARTERYRVQLGDTIYSIAWKLGLDYRVLASLNKIPSPYTIYPGQTLGTQSVAQPKVSFSVIRHPRSEVAKSPMFSHPIHKWVWPVRGVTVKRFSLGNDGSAGIDIAGRLGEPVVASAAGEVVYSATGVRGYGNLIIIKHNERYLSAYAYNERNLVWQGQRVRAGQKIALVGRNSCGRAMLYFEVRKDGRPLDPRRFF